jgi:hypothetical protein
MRASRASAGKGADAGALERLNFFPLSRDLIPHALDLSANMLKVHS